MVSKNHYAAWLYYSAAVQKEKNQVLKKRGCPITITAATKQSRERGGQGLSTCVVSIIHS